MRAVTGFILGGLLLPVVALANSPEENPEPAQVQDPVVGRGEQLLRASPQSILQLRQKIQEVSASTRAPIQHDFEPDIPQEVLNIDEIFDVTLGPDSVEPRIMIARYQSTAISFIDAYGKPWPIRKVSSWLDGLISIDRASEDSTSESDPDMALNDPQAGSFTLTALKHGVVGNITVFLVGQQTPISIMLVGKPAVYHRNATVRLQDVGPQTSRSDLMRSTGVVLGTEADVDLNHALYGVTPSGSEEMVLEGGEGKAWLKGDILFLRTPLAVFSPRIHRTSPGNGRYRAYKLDAATQILATNDEGRTVVLKVLRNPATALLREGNFK